MNRYLIIKVIPTIEDDEIKGIHAQVLGWFKRKLHAHRHLKEIAKKVSKQQNEHYKKWSYDVKGRPYKYIQSNKGYRKKYLHENDSVIHGKYMFAITRVTEYKKTFKEKLWTPKLFPYQFSSQ